MFPCRFLVEGSKEEEAKLPVLDLNEYRILLNLVCEAYRQVPQVVVPEPPPSEFLKAEQPTEGMHY